MSITVIRYLYCDGRDDCPLDGCPYDCSPPVDREIDRASAKLDGWKTNQPDGKDYCPTCYKRSKH